MHACSSGSGSRSPELAAAAVRIRRRARPRASAADSADSHRPRQASPPPYKRAIHRHVGVVDERDREHLAAAQPSSARAAPSWSAPGGRRPCRARPRARARAHPMRVDAQVTLESAKSAASWAEQVRHEHTDDGAVRAAPEPGVQPRRFVRHELAFRENRTAFPVRATATVRGRS